MTTSGELLTSALDVLGDANPSARLDAEVLLAYTLSKPRPHLRAWPDHPVADHHSTRFRELVARREALSDALAGFHACDDKPTIIIVRSIIGYGAPNKQDTHGCTMADLLCGFRNEQRRLVRSLVDLETKMEDVKGCGETKDMKDSDEN